MRTTRTWCCGVFIALTVGLGCAGAARAAGGGAGADIHSDSRSASLSEIRDRAEQMPIDRRIDMEKRIRAMVDRVNEAVESQTQSVLAKRLAPGFAMTDEVLLDEKGRLGWSWGDMVVAHTLLGGAAHQVTLRDLETLRSERLGWAAIAYGLQFHMEDLEDVIKAGGRVAAGIAGPSGEPSQSP